jgi:hypothetical protein
VSWRCGWPLNDLRLFIAGSMTPIERKFLSKAHEVQEHLRPRATAERTIPFLKWRTIGVLCDLSGEESDELVKQLAAADYVCIVDAGKRLIMLSTNSDCIRRELEARKQRRHAVVLCVAVALGAVVSWLVHRS